MKDLFLILTKWFYGEQDIAVATIDKIGNSKEFPDYNACFYTEKLIQKSKEFIDYFTNNGSDLDVKKDTEKTFIITTLSNNSSKAFICFKDINDIGEVSMKKHDYVFDKFLLLSNPSVVKTDNTNEKADIVLPIPTHLNEIFVPTEDEKAPLKVSGVLRCTCIGEDFKVKTLNDGDEQNPIVDGSYVRAVCNKCQQEHLIFDSHTHGWDGYVCHFLPVRPLEMKLVSFQCDKCNSTSFKVNITISSQGEEDFSKELEKEIEERQFTKEEWVDAFDWIAIALTCSECGKEFPQFVDYETM